jgi:hypothetical protein
LASSSASSSSANANSPDHSGIVAPATTSLVPTFTIAGSKDLGNGMVHFRQEGTEVGWSYQNTQFTHSITGHYYNPTQFEGRQVRVSVSNGCTVCMVVQGSVLADKSFYTNDSIASDTPSHCDLPLGFQENIAYANYSPSP